jgi:type I restriction enzyme R subunit
VDSRQPVKATSVTMASIRAVKKELRGVLKQFALPVTGELFDRAYLYVRENY